jgi:hypothetical protein
MEFEDGKRYRRYRRHRLVGWSLWAIIGAEVIAKARVWGALLT